jgi:hypothetical protein
MEARRHFLEQSGSAGRVVLPDLQSGPAVVCRSFLGKRVGIKMVLHLVLMARHRIQRVVPLIAQPISIRVLATNAPGTRARYEPDQL